MTEFKLPELGENVHQGDLVRLMISPGSNITEGQTVMELETDKAVVEVPSSITGTVSEVRVKEGEKIKVGQVIFTVENGAGAKSKGAARQNETISDKTNGAKDGEQGLSEPQTVAASTASPKKSAPSKVESRQASNRTTAVSDSNGTSEFKLPELGENVHQGDLVRLMISAGDKVSEGQPVMELETDKAVVEVPSSVSGVVKEVRVKQGEKVKVGQVIFTLEEGASAHQPQPIKQAPVEHMSEQHGARLAFQTAIEAEGKTEEEALPPDPPQTRPADFSMPVQLGKVAGTEHRDPVPAAPHVRRLARELGLDIHEVKGPAPADASAKTMSRPIRKLAGFDGGSITSNSFFSAPTARFFEVGKGRACLDARRPAKNRRTSLASLDHDSSRHPARQSRHHRARAAACAFRAKGGTGWRQNDRDCDRSQSMCGSVESVSSVQRQH